MPCQLWFLDRAKERDEARRDRLPMLDARNIHRQVTRAVFDFSPKQQQNIAAIVWLYRGQLGRFLELVESYLAQAMAEGSVADMPLSAFEERLGSLVDLAAPFTARPRHTDRLSKTWEELITEQGALSADIEAFGSEVAALVADWGTAGNGAARNNAALHTAREGLHDMPSAAGTLRSRRS